jgi:hypothetical protein
MSDVKECPNCGASVPARRTFCRLSWKRDYAPRVASVVPRGPPGPADRRPCLGDGGVRGRDFKPARDDAGHREDVQWGIGGSGSIPFACLSSPLNAVLPEGEFETDTLHRRRSDRRLRRSCMEGGQCRSDVDGN